MRSILFALILVISPCSVSLAETVAGNSHVELYLVNPGKFEVLHSRAKSTATGAALFGLIGAGIEESSRLSEDRKKEEAILEYVPDDACHNHLVQALEARLEEKGFTFTLHETFKVPRSPPDAYVMKLKIVACGFRMADAETEELSAYVKARFVFAAPNQELAREYEELLIAGKEKKTWEEFMADVGPTVQEFRNAKAKTGRRLANKIIYAK